ALRQAMEELPVALLGRAEVMEQGADLGIGGRLVEQREALAAPRLDERADQQPIRLEPGLGYRFQVRAQALRPGIRPPPGGAPAAPVEDAEHAPHVADLLGGERRHALDELGI